MVEIRAGGDRNGILVANKPETFGQGLSRRHAREQVAQLFGAQADEIVFLLDAVRACLYRSMPGRADNRDDDAAALHGRLDLGGKLRRNRDAGDVEKDRLFPVAGSQAGGRMAGDRVRVAASIGQEDRRHFPECSTGSVQAGSAAAVHSVKPANKEVKTEAGFSAGNAA